MECLLNRNFWVWTKQIGIFMERGSGSKESTVLKSLFQSTKLIMSEVVGCTLKCRD